MRIITFSREFGSGGRELGKRLADHMGFDYYDSEIISAIAQNSGMDEHDVERTLSHHGWQNVPAASEERWAPPPICRPARSACCWSRSGFWKKSPLWARIA